MDQIVGAIQLAKELNLTRQSIYVALRSKRLQGFMQNKIWIIKREDVEKFKKTSYKNCTREQRRRHGGDLVFTDDKKTYSAQQVALMFGVPRQRIYYLLRQRRLKSYLVGATHVIEIDDKNKWRQIIAPTN